MIRLGFAIPANQWQGRGMAPATLAEACRMAIEAEVEVLLAATGDGCGTGA